MKNPLTMEIVVAVRPQKKLCGIPTRSVRASARIHGFYLADASGWCTFPIG